MRRIALSLLCLALALPALAQTTLNGAGATFPYPMYSKWFSEYHKIHSDVQVNYQPIGSGGGIRQVTEATVDFGAPGRVGEVERRAPGVARWQALARS